MTKENRIQEIINKVKGLLNIANDNYDDAEAHSAFMLAQKLMIKYNIEQSQVKDIEKKEYTFDDVYKEQVTSWGKTSMEMLLLATVVSKNFKCKTIQNRGYGKTAISFIGLKEDVLLAKEVFILAVDCIETYSKIYVENWYKENVIRRQRGITSKLKKSYALGFYKGLNTRFEEQSKEIQQEFGLMVIGVPAIVEEFSVEKYGKPKNVKTNYDYNASAVGEGRKRGESFDHTRHEINC